jgi:hypothetical protein
VHSDAETSSRAQQPPISLTAIPSPGSPASFSKTSTAQPDHPEVGSARAQRRRQTAALTSLALNYPAALNLDTSCFAEHSAVVFLEISTEHDPEKKLAIEKRWISHLCRYSNSDGEFLTGLRRSQLSEGLRLIGVKEPVGSRQEYKALEDYAGVHLGKPHVKTQHPAPMMISYMPEHRLDEGKTHPSHRHEQKDHCHDHGP